jgi:integrase
MAQAKITRTLIRDLPPLPEGKTKVRVFDSQLPGFILEQRATGHTFYLRYRDERRRSREIKIGNLGLVTLDQARRKAEELKAGVSLGADPLAERERRRAIPTLAEFAQDRYLPHIKDRLRSYNSVEAQFRHRIIPILGRKALDEITQADIADLRRRLIEERRRNGKALSNASINRHLAAVRGLFSMAMKWDVVTGRNPAGSPQMLREQHRDKFLTPAETQALVRALDAEPIRNAAAALVLLILTGARKSEVLKARWADVDLDGARLKVPLSKSGKTRYIPLSSAAIAVLRQQADRAGEGDVYVFPGKKPGRPFEDIKGPWKRAKEAAGLPADLRIHDLRHSFASTLANLGTPLNEIGAILGHSQLSTTQRYAHHAQERLVQTAASAARAWDLLPSPEAEAA